MGVHDGMLHKSPLTLASHGGVSLVLTTTFRGGTPANPRPIPNPSS